MKILYFYSEVMGYTLAVIQELVKTFNAEVHVVYWDHKKKAAFQLPELDNVIYYKRSETNRDQLKQLIKTINPSLLYVSGRMDKDYLDAALFAQKLNIKTISGFDNQWHGTLKNYILAYLLPFLYKKYFNYLWVPGVYQYEYARRMGYAKNKIIWNLYSADTSLFSLVSNRNSVAKKFIFVGRFADVKGIDILIKAFLNLSNNNDNWKLLIIGNGPLKPDLPIHPNIEIIDFLQPQDLIEQLREGGVFVLPSRHEPWGVVIHEFATAGFPIICSDACGAGTAFVKNGYNGYIFPSNNEKQLTALLETVSSFDNERLVSMGKRSKELSNSINPKISAGLLMSIIDNESN